MRSKALFWFVAGVGFYFAGMEYLSLLIMLTTAFAMVPFVGPAIIWIPVATTFQLRSFRRFSIQCSVYYSSDALQGTGVAWNLSLNGWRIDGTHPVEPGTVVTLCVFLPDQHPTVFIDRAVVRWSRGQEFGIEVNEIKADEHARLEQFVTALV